MTSENMKLAYRFEVNTSDPYGGYYVDVDANNGEILNELPFIFSGDVQGEGMSLYNGLVNITVSDTTPESPDPPRWHPNRWMAFDQGGLSWWVADSTIGAEGGYGNKWYEVLETDTINLSGDNCRLSFYQRYSVEFGINVTEGYDAWDGFNVRISSNGGDTWDVLRNPDPAYTKTSIFSFGASHGEGPGVPGWSGKNNKWGKVSFDLSGSIGNRIKIRFAFASDYSNSTIDGHPELFGWQIDSILVGNAQDTLFSNNGEEQGLTAKNIAREVNIIREGKYRLREETRGRGIATYDLQNQPEYYLAQDFVDYDSSFSDSYERAGVSVHWASEATYDYFANKHNRLSYDDQNGRIVSYAHYDSEYANAFWNGSLNMALYGDGKLNNSSFVSVDIVGHELTHGVTQTTCALIYQNEPGALNESFSDIFGTMIEFYLENDNGDWLIGEDINLEGSPLRSLINPASLDHPDTYQGNNWFTWTSNPSEDNDWGGIHINCNVQNYWFYLLSEGGSGINDNGFAYHVTGIGRDAAAQIAYRNLTVYLLPTSNFSDARWGSINAAIDIYGHDSAQLQSVVDAWDAVGVEYPRLEPALAVFTDTLKFSAEAVVGMDTTSLIIYNYGLDTLIINNIQFSGGEFRLWSAVNFPLQLNSYEDYATIDLTFTPPSEGVITDSLIIFSNDPYQDSHILYLNGTGWVIHPVQDNTLYAVSSQPANSSLLRFDGFNDLWYIIGNTGYPFLTDISLNPLTNQLFATYPQSTKTEFLRIDTESGAAYHLATIPISTISKIAFDINGNLYGINTDSSNLYLLNMEKGEAIFKGKSEREINYGLTINPLNGILWASNDDGMLYKVDKTNAKLTRVGRTEFLACQSITFDASGNLYGLSKLGSDGDTTQLFIIDTVNANAKFICSTGHRKLLGLAINGIVITNIVDELISSSPQDFRLYQNHPNPFNLSTLISWQVGAISKSPVQVDLSVYNLLGQKVVTLVNEKQDPGVHMVEWDASGFASGVYYYRLVAGEFVDSKKLVVLK